MLLVLLASLAAEDQGVIIDLGGAVRSAELPPPSFAPLPRLPMTLDVQSVDVRVLLDHFARIGGQNIVVSEGVSGAVTLSIYDRPWDEGLALVLLGAGLQAQRLGDNLMVVSPIGR